ncbi:MAG: acyltransferase [Ilumatobacteraceae bacterium]|nr:acyltransferase [Ilumatobacteraceae bacterium]
MPQASVVDDDEFRPDIEGLRAVAVVVVVLFHARVSRFAGGFVGVDVFFVLSGFLITRLLLREVATTGTITLRHFWARRARRLLPASCVVVVATVIAAQVLLAPIAQRPLATDALAAGGFVVNFVFAGRLGDYFASQLGQTPSPLLHFWSLAVEEQFYLFWPLALLALRRRPRQYRRLVTVMMIIVAVASFVTCLWMTRAHPTGAFYLLPARMWELAIGGLVAVGGSAWRLVSPATRGVAAWIGVAGVATAVLTFDGSIEFPGSAALLPVLGTALIVVGGGTGAADFAPVAILRHRSLQWIGRRSYAIYLWHWPALVLAEAKWGPLSLGQRLIAIGVAVALAAASLRLVEDPVRHSTWVTSRPNRGLILGASLCATVALVGAISLAVPRRLATGTVAAAPVLALDAPTTTKPSGSAGAPAAVTLPNELVGNDLATLVAANQVVLAQGLATSAVPSNMRPSLTKLFDDRPAVYGDGCVAIGVDDTLNACRYGKTSSSVKIVLLGDSHAAQWFPPLRTIADRDGLELIVLAKGGCPAASVSIPTATLARTCPIWRDKAVQFIANEHPDLVILTGSRHYPNTDAEWRTGFDSTVTRLKGLTPRLLVLGDNPDSSEDPATCLSAHLNDVGSCINHRIKAVETGKLEAERTVAEQNGARFVDTSDWLCTATDCPLIIGDILLFRDINHLTTVAADWFTPMLEAIVLPYLRG